MGRVAVLAAALFALLFAACQKPDASYVTSPSVLALLGTTEGTPEFLPEGLPPEAIADSSDWSFDLGNARYTELENFTPSIQVVSVLVTKDHAAKMEMWLDDGTTTVWHWMAGPVAPYSGTLCFQLALSDDDSAIPLQVDVQYRLTIAFSADDGQPLSIKAVDIAGITPHGLSEKPLPGPDSKVGRVTLACPRTPL